MALNRRGFMASVLALGAAPWVAKAGVLMRVRPIDSEWYFVPPTFIAIDPTYKYDMTAALRYKRVGDLIVVESISFKDFYAA